MPADIAPQHRNPSVVDGRGKVFLAPELPQPRRVAQFEALRARYPDTFPNNEAAAQFLRSIHMPVSFRWAFLNNGKAGSSTARHLLFRLEFGVPMNVAWDVPHDINTDAAIHHMQHAGIWRPAAAIADATARMQNALRITTARHPASRAVSAFEYLCRSHDLRHSWFSSDRLRMNAMVRFDWNRHPRTADGFARFLDYIAAIRDDAGIHAVDPHWRPQMFNIRPQIFRPDLIGRLEAIPDFLRELSERLGQSLPPLQSLPQSNRQDYRSDWSALMTRENRSTLARVYAEDFEWLGYEHEDMI